MIPKIIHLCWFGKTKYPPIVQKCVDSWKQKLPDYQIMVWNEDTFKIDNYRFCKLAYAEKKWAFVCDYARLVVLKEYGGVYMDTDLEVIKDFSPLLEQGDYIGSIFEGGLITCGFIACSKNNEFIRKVIEYYDKKMIDSENNEALFVMNPPIFTKASIELYDYSLEYKSFCKNGFILYPMDYFMPYRKNLFGKNKYSRSKYIITKNTYTIHHDLGSWGKANPISKAFKGLMRLLLPSCLYLYFKKKRNERIIKEL